MLHAELLKESYCFCSFDFGLSEDFSKIFLFDNGEGSGIFFSVRDDCLDLRQEEDSFKGQPCWPAVDEPDSLIASV